MCGIAGFWQTRRGDDAPAAILSRMGTVLKHRGPDDWGTFFDEATGLGMVHRRLSIVDLSPAGHQPMTSSSGRYTITFNGEVYNFNDLRAELGNDHPWKGHSDTEIMLESIERWGVDGAVRKFVGMFAFALWDRLERVLYLVRDRLGIKPLYCGWVGGDFVFASELKAIRQYPGFESTIDRDALALYMRHNYVPAPHCIYSGIRKLQPGHILRISSDRAGFHSYPFWSAKEVVWKGVKSRIDASDREVVGELGRELKRAVSLRMIADVPLGAFLSGGVDSSTVVALMQAQSSRPVKTFTIGFHEDGFNEAKHAAGVAAHLGTDHTELYLTSQEAMDVVPSLAEIFDEPFGDSSQIPTLLVSRLARQSVTVSLSGDGGDELFGGYNRYLFTKRLWRVLRQLPGAARKGAAGLLLGIPPEQIDRLSHLLKPIHGYQSPAGDQAHKLAAFFQLSSPQAIYKQALSHWDEPQEVVPGATEPATVAEFIGDASSLPDFEEAMMLTDLCHYLPDDILTKVDRASMAVALEARVPLLDHNVVEFAWRLPLRFKIRRGVGKWALRQVLAQYVPPALVDRPKMGFAVPIASWLRGDLREWAEDLLAPSSLAAHGLFEAQIIRRHWQEHLSGIRNWQARLWDVLMFQDWYARHARVRQMVA